VTLGKAITSDILMMSKKLLSCLKKLSGALTTIRTWVQLPLKRIFGKGHLNFTAVVKEVREFLYQTGRWIKEDGPQAIQMPFHLLKLGILILLGAKVF